MWKRFRFGFRSAPGASTLGALVLAGCAGGSTSTAPRPAQQPETPPAAQAEPAPTPEAQPAPVALGIDLDTVRAGLFDNGKMWTFEYPPLQYFAETYDFTPDSVWFERARLGALRLPTCTASFVSPNGLVMTNHHCARESVSAVSQPGENLLDNGFYARALADERAIEDLYLDQLITIVDVSEEISAALEGATTDAERSEKRDAASEAISARIREEYGGETEGIEVEIISLWNGARYSAYVLKRYSDVRLVMAPELMLGQFGGDPDNFTYPRYSLDMSFLRIYDQNGEPLKPEIYFSFSEGGAAEGDVVFVVGNPGGSSRLQTVAQLEYRRAVQDKAILDLYTSRLEVLQAYYAEDTEEAESIDLRNQIFSHLNAQKAYTGIWEGLHDPVIRAKRLDAERRFLAAIESDPELAKEYSGLAEQMAEIQDEKANYAADFGAFLALGSPDFTSSVMLRAIWGFQYVAGRNAGATLSALDNVKEQFLAVPEQPLGLQRALLTARLADFERYLGDEPAREILRGRTPEAAAAAIVSGSVIADSAQGAHALEAGTLSFADPAIQMVPAFIQRFGAYQRAITDLNEREDELTIKLGRARFEVDGVSIPPDATFSLRIADGVVKGYEYNGTYAPTHTTFYGLYDHYFSYGPGSDWDLPERWTDAPESFDLATPLNFVLTADIIGGNSGSPVLNRELEVVGLVFDGNIESLPGEYIYDPTTNRAVAVDVRGILEALDDIYDADRIVLELTSGRLARDESEADALRAGG